MTVAAQTLRLPLWVRVLDILTIALLFLALAVWVTGGFVLNLGGMRVSFRSEWRIVLWAAGLLVVRHLFFRRPSIDARLRSWLRRTARTHAVLPRDEISVASEPRGRGTRRRMALSALAVIALFGALTVAMTYPQIRVISTGVSPDIADPLLSTWRLSWIAHQLPRDPRHLFDANIFYPVRNTLAFSDAMLVPSLMAAPFVWLGVHQLLVYNVLLLSAFALSGATMFLLVWSLTRHSGAALVAGFVFAFLPFRFMHYAHLELQMSQWMPLCLWSLHRTVSGGRWRDGLLTGFFVALQTLSSFYYGMFFVVFLIPIGAALLIDAGWPRLWPAVRALAAGGALAAVLVVPVTRPYFAARQDVGERPLSEVAFYSAVPRDYFVAHGRNTLFGPVSAGMGAQERELFQGIAVPLLALIAVWPPVSAVRMGYAVSLALAFELSLGTHGLLFPWLREHVLPFRGLRVPARMGMLVGLSLAILVGFAVARISRSGTSRAARLAAVAVIGLAVAAEYHSTLVLKDVWRRPPPVYDALANQRDAVLLELPLIIPDVALEPIYMYFSTFHWHRLINGYSGFSPPAYTALLRRMVNFPDDDTIAELRRRGADYLVVHGAFFEPKAFPELVRSLDRRPDLDLVSVTRWENRETRLYRLVK